MLPPIETLTRHLAECPAEFLAEPRLGARGLVAVPAVVADVLVAWGAPPLTAAQGAGFHQLKYMKEERNWLRVVLVACWLLHAPALRAPDAGAEKILSFLQTDLAEAAKFTPAPDFVADPDRREELARLCLQALGLRPAGESEAQAQDRLTTLNTAERQRVMHAARQAEIRAQAIRQQMAEQAARDAEMKTMRE